jgi:hypothetical protein
MYYRDKNGNKIDGKIIKENYSGNMHYPLLVYFGTVFFSLILSFVLKDNLPDINISLLPFVSKDVEKIVVYGVIIGLLLGLLINYIVYRS